MEARDDLNPGFVCTFYSYKGGVGRSMALANVAVLLSRMGHRVLVVDWDLEAPGLEKYLAPVIGTSSRDSTGLLDLICAYVDGQKIDWHSCLTSKQSVTSVGHLALIHAGRDTPDYLERLRKIDWDMLFRDRDLGRYLDNLREEWRSEYDFILIDSRTGITDVGGICSILMPDCLLCFFTTNEQSLIGIKDTMLRARRVHAELPLDRQRLMVVPVPSRDESQTEYKLALEWRRRFAEVLGEFYSEWIPRGELPESVLDYLKIPYVAYWSFGEKLPVLSEDSNNPKTLSYSFRVLARLIDSRLDWRAARTDANQAEKPRDKIKEAQEAAYEALASEIYEESEAKIERLALAIVSFRVLLSMAVIPLLIGGIFVFALYYFKGTSAVDAFFPGGKLDISIAYAFFAGAWAIYFSFSRILSLLFAQQIRWKEALISHQLDAVSGTHEQNLESLAAIEQNFHERGFLVRIALMIGGLAKKIGVRTVPYSRSRRRPKSPAS